MKSILLALCLFISVPAWAESLNMIEVSPGIYVHQGAHEALDMGYHGDIANIGFIVGTAGIAVIDTGGSLEIGQKLREAIRKISSLPITYVINTHVHPDHVFGNAAFLQDQPAFVGHVNLAETMEKRRAIYLRNNLAWLGKSFEGSELIKPTLPVEKTLEIDLGHRKLILNAWSSAHTTTDLTVFDVSSATLWTGDLLFIERAPSIDGDTLNWLKVLNEIKSTPAKKVIPGHGQPTHEWQKAIDKEQHYFELLISDIRRDIKQGVTLEKSIETAGNSEKNNWVLFDTVNRRNVNILYPVLEWE